MMGRKRTTEDRLIEDRVFYPYWITIEDPTNEIFHLDFARIPAVATITDSVKEWLKKSVGHNNYLWDLRYKDRNNKPPYYDKNLPIIKFEIVFKYEKDATMFKLRFG